MQSGRSSAPGGISREARTTKSSWLRAGFVYLRYSIQGIRASINLYIYIFIYIYIQRDRAREVDYRIYKETNPKLI